MSPEKAKLYREIVRHLGEIDTSQNVLNLLHSSSGEWTAAAIVDLETQIAGLRTEIETLETQLKELL